MYNVYVASQRKRKPLTEFPYGIWHGKVESFLDALDNRESFDLVVTSPPYNLGKERVRQPPVPGIPVPHRSPGGRDRP